MPRVRNGSVLLKNTLIREVNVLSVPFIYTQYGYGVRRLAEGGDIRSFSMSLTAFDDTIDHLKARWADADKNFLLQLFPLIAVGRPI